MHFLSLCALCLFGELPLFAQFNDEVERNALALRSLSGCAEGYTRAVSGETIEYPRLNPNAPVALLTRASTGFSAIEWMTGTAPRAGTGGNVAFAVAAGIYSQEEEGRTFRMFVNGIPRFVFRTTRGDSWKVSGSEGGNLSFHGIMRDEHRDVFGYLKITLPAAWLSAGAPPRLRVVGDSTGSRAWFMVYMDTAVMVGLRQRVDDEAYCDITIDSRGPLNVANVVAASSWAGRRLTCDAGGRQASSVLEPAGGHASGVIRFEAEGTVPVTFDLDGDTLANLADLSHDTSASRITPRRIITLKVAHPSSGRCLMQYQSTHAPALGMSLVRLSSEAGGAGVLALVNSSHQDIAWMDSPEQCIRDRDEKVITPALTLMRRNPSYCFDLEDVLCLREYLGRHPGSKEEIRQRLVEGRLGVGASFNEPYEDLCSGEMLAREFYAGRKWFRKNFPGCDTRTAWNPDVPGRTLQSPQVMHKAGVRYLVLSRQDMGIYRWLSPDSTGVLVFSPGHYALFLERTAGKPFPESAAYLASFARTWRSRTGGTVTPVLAMSDMSAPGEYDSFMEKWRTLVSISGDDGRTIPLTLPRIAYSTASRFMDSVAAEDLHVRVLKGERPNIWLYIHGPTHHRAVSAKREADLLLPAAETFSTVDALLANSFASYPQTLLTEAWESQIYPDHGWGGKNGDVTDSTFQAKYEHARDIGRQIYDLATRSIASRVKTDAGKGLPLVVFNALSWNRSGPIRCSCSFPAAACRKEPGLFDAAGRPVAAQVLTMTHHRDGSIASVEILFVARDVPAVGYATYYVRPSVRRPPSTRPQSSHVETLENEFYKLTLGGGGIRQIYDKERGVALLQTEGFLGGELFTMQSVGEDAGEWAEPQQPTMEGFDRLSSHTPEWRLVESGPVRQTIEAHGQINHATVIQRVSLYRGLKRIDIETSLIGWDGTRYREFRLAFPFDMLKGRIAYEVPFGTLEVGKDEMQGAPGERYTQQASAIHPRSIQNWIGVSDDRIGVTISSSVAVWDYQDPTGLSGGCTFLQPLLLASRRSCNGEGNWYLQKGDHLFRFSLTSHAPGWRNGMRSGIGANAPMTAVFNPAESTRQTLPEKAGFLSIGAEKFC